MPPLSAARRLQIEARHEGDLDVRDLQLRAGAQEAPGLQRHGGGGAAAGDPGTREGGRSAIWAEQRVKRHRIGAGIREIDAEMVLQVRTDAWKVMHRLDPVPGQRRAVADPRQHQELRRVDGAARQDDLPPRRDLALGAAPTQDETGRAAVLDHDAAHHGPGPHGQVRARHRRAEEGGRAADPAAVLHVEVVQPQPYLIGAVEVVVGRSAVRPPGGKEIGVERVLALRPGHAQRAALAVKRIARPLRIVLRPAKIGQHVVVSPAREATLRPAVVIGRMAAHVHHAVDRGRAAQHLAPRPFDAPPVQPRLRRGLVVPVRRLMPVGNPRQQRDAEERVAVAAPGLDQQDRSAVRAEPVGEHASGRTGADDDVVEAVHVAPQYGNSAPFIAIA